MKTAMHRITLALIFSQALPLTAASVATPKASPPEGTYTSSVTVSLSTTTKGATIRYSKTGSVSTSSPKYTAPLTLTSTTTLRARAFLNDSDSGSLKAVYTVRPAVVPTPKFSQTSGVYVAGVLVEAPLPESDAVLRYTTDGSVPNSSSPKYSPSKSLRFSTTTTLKMRTYRDGVSPSSVTTATYTIAAVLFLHGLNSDASAWDDMAKELKKYGGTCHELSPAGSVPAASCFTYTFEDYEWNGEFWPNGDNATYTQLRVEVANLVNRIVAKNAPKLLIIVGHSRGGLAARAYLQSIEGRRPPTKLALLTIGTPHRGSPLARVKWWMDTHNYKKSDAGWLFWFLFSPSTGYMATTPSNPTPVPAPELATLNRGMSGLNSCCVAYGEIVSSSLRLGENLVGDFDFLDGVLTSPAAFLPGKYSELRDFVLQNLPDGWRNNTDGVVPLESQKLGALSGFSRTSGMAQKTLSKVSHTDETGEVAHIRSMLEKLASSANVLSFPSSPVDLAMPDAAPEVSGGDVVELVDGYLAALETNDTLLAAPIREELRRRADDPTTVPALVAHVDDSAEGHAALHMLGYLRTPDALEAVLRIAQDVSGASIRSFALLTLESVRWTPDREAVKQLSRTLESAAIGDESLYRSVAIALARIGTELAVRPLLSGLGSIDLREQAAAAEALTFVRNDEALPVLAEALGEPFAFDRRRAVIGEALSKMGSERATRILLAWAMSAHDELTQASAVRWIEKARDSGSLLVLRQTLENDPPAYLRHAIRGKLEQHAPPQSLREAQ
jgi:HEAT repeat protein/pimeloyl-ACP methyl ester carboxylesterase